MSKATMCKAWALVLALAMLLLLAAASVFGLFAFAEEGQDPAGQEQGGDGGEGAAGEEGAAYSKAVEALRGEDAGNWAVGTYADGAFTPVAGGAAGQYTYYTTQQWQGKTYTKNDGTDFAFVPDEITYTKADFFVGDEAYLQMQEYSVVLVNGSEDMALAYTADAAGTLYFQDLAQVAPLHWDDREQAGVYGEYRIYRIGGGNAEQVYPAEGAHQLEAANAAPTTSAWVNSSVEMDAGDKLVFVSEKDGSTVFSSPVVSDTAFPERYELKNFWKWQQINDANYFEAVYRQAEDSAWTRFPNLETKKTEWDLDQRSQTQYLLPHYWTDGDDWGQNFIGAFGGMWIHASGNPRSGKDGNNAGVGDIGYAFKVPHDGFVDIDLKVVGQYGPAVEIWYNGEKLTGTQFDTTDGDTICKKGMTLSAKAIPVTEGAEIYFVQRTDNNGSCKQDFNPVITYVEAPYTLDKSEIGLEEGDSETLTLTLNPAYALTAEDVEWALAAGGEEVVELTENGTSATVRGIKGGQTVLSVSAGGYTAVTCKLTVTAAVKNEFTLSSSALSVEAGKTGTFTVTIADGSAVTAADLEVMSEDDTVATAAIDGTTVTVTGLKKGTVNIFVTAEGSLSASVSVTVTEPQKDPGTATDPGDNGTASDPGDNGTDDGKEGGCGSFAGAGSLLGGGAVLALGALLMKKKK